MSDKSKHITFQDGSVYFGNVNDDGLPHGRHGTYIWEDGRRYIGSWQNGKKHGVGRLYDADGNETYGFWFEDEFLHEFKKQDTPSRPINKQRVTALLIGNNEYPNQTLHNCVKDARAIGEKLRSIGVDVTIKENVSMSKFFDAIKGLSSKDKMFDHVFFFFSGHGVTNQGRHYLQMIPAEGEKTLFSIEDIDELLCRTDFQNIILVSDACCSIVGVEGDDTPVNTIGRTLMAFSSTLGQTSSDGIPDDHSPYAYGLLEYIDQPMEIVQMFREAHRFASVYAYKTSDKIQLPVLHVSALFPMDFRLF